MGELPSERGKMPLRFRPEDDDFGASPLEAPPACTSSNGGQNQSIFKALIFWETVKVWLAFENYG
jgi:hypothetical protein